jgi:hypothetical protein
MQKFYKFIKGITKLKVNAKYIKVISIKTVHCHLGKKKDL